MREQGNNTCRDVSAGRIQPKRPLHPNIRPQRNDVYKRQAVFQEDRLCENLSVAANIRMPHPQAKGPAKERLLQRAAALLESMDMHDTLHRPVHGLSGGQKRRVAIARAVLAEADVMFFDEPLKGLDEKTERRVMEAIAPLLAQKTVFWVTHHASDLAYFDNPVLTRIEKPC